MKTAQQSFSIGSDPLTLEQKTVLTHLISTRTGEDHHLGTGVLHINIAG